jgi:hypothetical protein
VSVDILLEVVSLATKAYNPDKETVRLTGL